MNLNPEQDPTAQSAQTGQSSYRREAEFAASTVGVQWLPATTRTSRRLFLAGVLRAWQQSASGLTESGSDAMSPQMARVPHRYERAFGLESLSAMLEDLWAIERMLQPDVDLAVLTPKLGDLSPKSVLGVITASARPYMNAYFIHSLCVHPNLFFDANAFELAATLLTETIVDESLATGLRGWVACNVEDNTDSLWTTLGFVRKSGPFFARMGYVQDAPRRETL